MAIPETPVDMTSTYFMIMLHTYLTYVNIPGGHKVTHYFRGT
jgi:hypothetical protein